MARQGTKRATKSAAKSKSIPKSTIESESAKMAPAQEQAENGEQSAVVVFEAAKPTTQFFETFESKANLNEGLCVVRKLANGKYEVLSLNPSVHRGTALGTTEFGRQVREEPSGERLKMLEDVEKTWKGAEFGFGQAVSSASKSIVPSLGIFFPAWEDCRSQFLVYTDLLIGLRLFRFLDLPIELRYKIYDFTISSKKKLRHGHWDLMADQILPGIQLRGTCRQVYDETHHFFWRNNFRFFGTKEIKSILPFVTENLREATLIHFNFKLKDKETLKMLRNCVNLETFHLRLTSYSIAPHNGQNSYTVWEYAKEPAVEKFRGMAGFRELMDLRGLKTVTVENHDIQPAAMISPLDLTVEELKAFEAFVIKKITQPRPPKKLEVCAELLILAPV